MTNLTNLVPLRSFGDLLTTTNGGNGLTPDLANLQDGYGNNSSIQISTDATKFTNILGIPFGTADDQPLDPIDGSLFFNTDINSLQIFFNNAWNNV